MAAAPPKKVVKLKRNDCPIYVENHEIAPNVTQIQGQASPDKSIISGRNFVYPGEANYLDIIAMPDSEKRSRFL